MLDPIRRLAEEERAKAFDATQPWDEDAVALVTVRLPLLDALFEVAIAGASLDAADSEATYQEAKKQHREALSALVPIEASERSGT